MRISKEAFEKLTEGKDLVIEELSIEGESTEQPAIEQPTLEQQSESIKAVIEQQRQDTSQFRLFKKYSYNTFWMVVLVLLIIFAITCNYVTRFIHYDSSPSSVFSSTNSLIASKLSIISLAFVRPKVNGYLSSAELKSLIIGLFLYSDTSDGIYFSSCIVPSQSGISGQPICFLT